MIYLFFVLQSNNSFQTITVKKNMNKISVFCSQTATSQFMMLHAKKAPGWPISEDAFGKPSPDLCVQESIWKTEL